MSQEIWDDADWLRSLVEDILNLTRLEDGRLVLQKQPEAVEEIIANALEHIAKRAPEREIGVDIPEDPAARSHGRQADRADAGEPAG